MLVPVRLAGYMCEVQAPAHHSKVAINAGAVEADRAVLLLYRCAFAGGCWQQEEEARTKTEPPQLSAVLQLLHTTYQKGLAK